VVVILARLFLMVGPLFAAHGIAGVVAVVLGTPALRVVMVAVVVVWKPPS